MFYPKLILLACLVVADQTTLDGLVPVTSPPQLDYSSFGGSLDIFGSFDGLSVYSYVNESSFLNQKTTAGGNNLYLRQTTNNKDVNIKLGTLNGQVAQAQALTNESFIVNGNYTSFNNQSVSGPSIYSLSAQNISSLLPSDANGTVSSFFVDGNLIYLGGDFTINNTVGAAVYNMDTQTLNSLPFQGFGKNAVVNAITKVTSDNSDGSIIFGGQFNTLGLKELLLHNSSLTNNTYLNSTNSSLINAEQIISLKNGIFTNVNSAGSTQDSALICPSVDWSLSPGVGGEWAVELPDEMKGLTPTKARLYVPTGSDGAKTFRIYSYPNNGIMNLSYVDPSTNEIAYCDAWCPLLTGTQLANFTETNKKSLTNTSETDLTNNQTFIDDNGSFSMYYDPLTKTKTLGYGSDFQEFSFANSVQIEKVGVTIIDWYGSAGALGGFQIYLNTITVFGNSTLNLPNCAGEDVDNGVNNFARVQNGTFVSVLSVDPSLSGINYLVTNDTDAKITLYPNITYSGNYSFIITTPGCIADDSCSKRPIVNVTVISDSDELLSTKLIYQNNNYDKFDYLFYGHLNGSQDSTDNFVSNSDHNGENRIEISYAEPIGQDQESFMVVDKVVATIVSLDNYYDRNLTNSTMRKKSGGLTYVNLNGLFEYSLGNFSDFDESLVSSLVNNRTIISPNNTFVGNSSINLLSGELASNTSIDQLLIVNDRLLIRGNLHSNSPNLTLSSNQLAALTLSYNTTANATDGEISNLSKRGGLSKRADLSSNGASFNNSDFKLFDIPSGVLFIGEFQAQSESGTTFKDLSNSNSSTSTINNFALFLNNQWFGFGNSFSNLAYDLFANTTIGDTDFYIFSASQSSNSSQVWDTLKSAFSSSFQLDINTAIRLSPTQQVLSGDSVNIMDTYSRNQAGINSDSDFTSFNFTVTSSNSTISQTYYVNKSLSVIAGDFETTSVSKIGLLNNNSTLSGLNGDIKWSNDSIIQSVYVDSNAQYLFVGFNGSATVGGSTLSGVLIYNLQNNTVSSFQPPQLTNGNDPVSVNSIVLYNKGNLLLVGGDFDSAGSLGCNALCVYDIANTRWESPQSVSTTSNSVLFSGVATDIRFYQSNEVLISGNLTLNNDAVNFITYNFDSGSMGTNAPLNSLGTSNVITKYIVNDQSNSDLSARLVALGLNFVSGFNGTGWNKIDSEIVYDSTTRLDDVKLLNLANSNSNNTGAYFDKSMTLLLAGKFSLKNYGSVNLAFFNGTNWIPYVFTSTNQNQLGGVRSILIKDNYRFTSSNEIKESNKFLSKGKVVGISLACALGSTTLLGLLYIIPYFALFRKLFSESEMRNQRIHENDMLGAVNPEDLLHEIDLQRNT